MVLLYSGQIDVTVTCDKRSFCLYKTGLKVVFWIANGLYVRETTKSDGFDVQNLMCLPPSMTTEVMNYDVNDVHKMLI